MRIPSFIIGLAAALLASSTQSAPFAYIGNASVAKVSVIDTASNMVVANVPLPESAVTGFSVSPDRTRVYAASSYHLFVIDAVTNAVVASVTIGPGIGGYAGVAMSPNGKRVYVTSNWNQFQDVLHVVDTGTNAIIATIPVGDTPVGVAVNPAGTRIYVVNMFSNDITVIDAVSHAIVGTVDLTVGSPCGRSVIPFGIAIDAAGNRAYVANQNCMSPEGYWYATVVDLRSNAVDSHVAIGTSPSGRGVAISPDGGRVYISNGAVIDAATLKMVASFQGGSLNGLAVSPDGKRLYLPVLGYPSNGSVLVIDTTTYAVVANVSVGGNAMAFGQFVGPAASAPPSANYQGLWWKAPAESESGWGINFAHQGDIVFATWFTYGADGKPQWYTIRAQKTATGVYSGPVSSFTGLPFNTVPYTANANVKTPVGTATITFAADGWSAIFTYTVNGITQTKQLVPQQFTPSVPLATCVWGAQLDLTLATNYQDLWWVTDGQESGWGINFTHQGNVIFATWFTYDSTGKAWWLFSVAAETGESKVYSGVVRTATGPPFNADPFDPNAVIRTTVGNAAITFIDGNHAKFDYTVSGVTQTKNLTRQVFAPPGTVCQ